VRPELTVRRILKRAAESNGHAMTRSAADVAVVGTMQRSGIEWWRGGLRERITDGECSAFQSAGVC